VLCLHRKVSQVRSLAVSIVAKRSDPDWVSSNMVPYIREPKSLTVRIVANYGDMGRAAIIMDLE